MKHYVLYNLHFCLVMGRNKITNSFYCEYKWVCFVLCHFRALKLRPFQISGKGEVTFNFLT